MKRELLITKLMNGRRASEWRKQEQRVEEKWSWVMQQTPQSLFIFSDSKFLHYLLLLQPLVSTPSLPLPVPLFFLHHQISPSTSLFSSSVTISHSFTFSDCIKWKPDSVLRTLLKSKTLHLPFSPRCSFNFQTHLTATASYLRNFRFSGEINWFWSFPLKCQWKFRILIMLLILTNFFCVAMWHGARMEMQVFDVEVLLKRNVLVLKVDTSLWLFYL